MGTLCSKAPKIDDERIPKRQRKQLSTGGSKTAKPAARPHKRTLVVQSGPRHPRPPDSDSSSSPIPMDARNKRVGQACERCRKKKTRCDGCVPCRRCKEDNEICTRGQRKRQEYKQHPKGYCEMLERNLRTSAAVIKSLVDRCCHCSKCNLGDLERNSSGEPIIHLVAKKLGCVQTYDELDMFVPTLYPQNESDFASLTAELEERQKTVAKSDADDDGPHETPQKPQLSEDMQERVREMQATARMSVGAGLYQDQKRQQQEQQQQQHHHHHHHRLQHQQSNTSELLFYQPYSAAGGQSASLTGTSLAQLNMSTSEGNMPLSDVQMEHHPVSYEQRRATYPSLDFGGSMAMITNHYATVGSSPTSAIPSAGYPEIFSPRISDKDPGCFFTPEPTPTSSTTPKLSTLSWSNNPIPLETMSRRLQESSLLSSHEAGSSSPDALLGTDENKICQGAEMTDVYGMYEYEPDFDLLPNTGIYI